jgi:hypothetical protein
MVKRATCHDCGAKEGQLHVFGCDMECCPFCGHQLFSCLMFGCEEASQKDWKAAVRGWEKEDWGKSKRRIPFILYPNLCARCGRLWPEMFKVPDAEWKHYVEPRIRHEMFCKACYEQIKAWIDGEGLGLKP